VFEPVNAIPATVTVIESAASSITTWLTTWPPVVKILAYTPLAVVQASNCGDTAPSDNVPENPLPEHAESTVIVTLACAGTTSGPKVSKRTSGILPTGRSNTSF